MKIDAHSRRWTRFNNLLFIALFLAAIGLLAWFSTQYRLEADWTFGNRNTVSAETRELLARIDQPLHVTAYLPDDGDTRQYYAKRIERYQRFKPDITLDFVNPDLDPERASRDGVERTGQLVLRLGGRSQVVGDPGEQTLTNALQRLTREGERRALFLEGHGERDLAETGNKGYAQLAQVLKSSGLVLQPYNLVRTPALPDNVALVVLAGPRAPLLEGEVTLLRAYLANGGNLLWLQEPGEMLGLDPLAQDLGIGFEPGMLVDNNRQLRMLLGLDHPAIIPVAEYGTHAITADLDMLTLFPVARPITLAGSDTWVQTPLLATLQETWLETGPLEGNVDFDPTAGDVGGPLVLGAAFERALDARDQRVVVIGDSDFLSNSFIGHGGNLNLATSLFNWLSADDALISITTRSAPDTQLDLAPGYSATIGLFFIVILPLGLLVAGGFIWLRRRKR